MRTPLERLRTAIVAWVAEYEGVLNDEEAEVVDAFNSLVHDNPDIEKIDPKAPYGDEDELPAIGSRWDWEKGKEQARELGITVAECEKRGDEWWVRTVGPTGTYWNSLDRFHQATTPATREA